MRLRLCLCPIQSGYSLICAFPVLCTEKGAFACPQMSKLGLRKRGQYTLRGDVPESASSPLACVFAEFCIRCSAQNIEVAWPKDDRKNGLFSFLSNAVVKVNPTPAPPLQGRGLYFLHSKKLIFTYILHFFELSACYTESCKV